MKLASYDFSTVIIQCPRNTSPKKNIFIVLKFRKITHCWPFPCSYSLKLLVWIRDQRLPTTKTSEVIQWAILMKQIETDQVSFAIKSYGFSPVSFSYQRFSSQLNWSNKDGPERANDSLNRFVSCQYSAHSCLSGFPVIREKRELSVDMSR